MVVVEVMMVVMTVVRVVWHRGGSHLVAMFVEGDGDVTVGVDSGS